MLSVDPVIPGIAVIAPDLIAVRRQIHAHPELAFQERATSDLVASLLTQWGYDVTRGLGKTGVVGVLKLGSGSGRIGLRADMDALPIEEATGLPCQLGRTPRRRQTGRPHGAVRRRCPPIREDRSGLAARRGFERQQGDA